MNIISVVFIAACAVASAEAVFLGNLCPGNLNPVDCDDKFDPRNHVNVAYSNSKKTATTDAKFDDDLVPILKTKWNVDDTISCVHEWEFDFTEFFKNNIKIGFWRKKTGVTTNQIPSNGALMKSEFFYGVSSQNEVSEFGTVSHPFGIVKILSVRIIYCTATGDLTIITTDENSNTHTFATTFPNSWAPKLVVSIRRDNYPGASPTSVNLVKVLCYCDNFQNLCVPKWKCRNKDYLELNAPGDLISVQSNVNNPDAFANGYLDPSGNIAVAGLISWYRFRVENGECFKGDILFGGADASINCPRRTNFPRALGLNQPSNFPIVHSFSFAPRGNLFSYFNANFWMGHGPWVDMVKELWMKFDLRDPGNEYVQFYYTTDLVTQLDAGKISVPSGMSIIPGVSIRKDCDLRFLCDNDCLDPSVDPDCPNA